MRLYADTSVFGGVFDKEFAEPSKELFREVDAGRFGLVTSALVDAEIELAPTEIRLFFERYAKYAEIIEINNDALILQSKYIDSGIVTKKSLDDALHVALATISRCDLIIS